VVLVRHPLAFYYSQKRLGWDFDFRHFLSQEALIEHHLRDEVPQMEQRLDYAERMALLWRCLYKVLHAFGAEREAAAAPWLVVRHEDLCMQPEARVRHLFEALSLAWTPSVRAHVLQRTSGEHGIEATANRHDDLERDTQKLSTYWKQHVTPREMHAVRRVVADIADVYYEAASWDL
jgi:hypothetical protein